VVIVKSKNPIADLKKTDIVVPYSKVEILQTWRFSE
jgi:hypothetical protein